MKEMMMMKTRLKHSILHTSIIAGNFFSWFISALMSRAYSREMSVEISHRQTALDTFSNMKMQFICYEENVGLRMWETSSGDVNSRVSYAEKKASGRAGARRSRQSMRLACQRSIKTRGETIFIKGINPSLMELSPPLEVSPKLSSPIPSRHKATCSTFNEL